MCLPEFLREQIFMENIFAEGLNIIDKPGVARAVLQTVL